MITDTKNKMPLLGGILILLLLSCRSSNQETIRVENIICQPIICGDNYIIGGPREMALSDSILAVMDAKSDSMLLFFNVKSGKYLGKAGIRGQGPSEFTVLSSLESHGGGSFSFYDINKKTFYYTNSVMGDGVQFIPAFRVDSGLPLEVHPMANGKFIAPGIYEEYRYCVLDSSGQVHNTFGEWPYRDEDEKKVSGIVRSQAYMFGIAPSPSKTKFIASLLSADILSFYQLENDSVHLLKETILTYPDYEYRNSPTVYSGASKDSPINYLCATCSENYVYVLYSGKNFRQDALASFSGNVIYVYTWNGNKIAMLKSDKMLGKICLAEDGKTMYAIAYDLDPVLVQFPLPQWE
ncbi:BF3164 family lipoprotein [Bacteroides acidifaciens]|nr:BF3164 family lipoprotein [Bacteroides acidifaciens]